MVGGLATLGFVPLRPRERIDLVSLVVWFALYKVGIFALVTVQPRATRAIFLGALGIDLLLVFVLVLLTGGGGSLFYLLFFPLVAVNAYYFGPWVAFVAALIAGGLMAAAASLAPPWIGWTGVTLLVVLFGLPAVAVGIVADRERRARGEVEGLLNRLQAAQQELLVAERMATVRRRSRAAAPSRSAAARSAMASRSRWPTRARASPPRSATASSSSSSPRSRRARGSGSRSRARSSTSTAASCAGPTGRAAAPCSRSGCP